MSQELRDARAYEEKMEKRITAAMRPEFHLSARTGWMNDPNGLSYYNGMYHMFYQYHPYDAHWGPMHWGHAVSTDLLHWEYRPAALAPDQKYDSGGCFSGSALTLPDGRQLLMYTGVEREQQPDGMIRDIQRQCIAVGNGMNYEKYAGNPVLDQRDLPSGGSRYDFRDPKIWQDPDGTFRCVIGSCTAEKDGRILLYSSDDGFEWRYEKVLAANNQRFGRMWECPDFFALDGKWALLTSPQDMLPHGLTYHSGDGTLCLIGSYDRNNQTFTEEQDQPIDCGLDFYAPQTLLTPDGRRVMIGWMQNWDSSTRHPRERPWFGQMSLPRELSLRDGCLIQQPIRELEYVRRNKVGYQGVAFTGAIRLDRISGRTVDMEIDIRPADPQNMYREFCVHVAQNQQYRTTISFRPEESVVEMNREGSGSRRDFIHRRSCLVKGEMGKLKIRLILDRYSVEMFLNNGEQAMTATICTEQEADQISFWAEGNVKMDVVKYELVSDQDKQIDFN